MMLNIIFLAIVVLIFLWGVSLFVPTIIELMVNLPILYFISIRTHTDLKDEKRYTEYLLGLLAALFFFLAKRDLFYRFETGYILWSPTIFLMIGFIAAQIVIMINTMLNTHNPPPKTTK